MTGFCFVLCFLEIQYQNFDFLTYISIAPRNYVKDDMAFKVGSKNNFDPQQNLSQLSHFSSLFSNLENVVVLSFSKLVGPIIIPCGDRSGRS